jgi:phospholipid/cholesterol/gamma-HCH transport system substrate-binding protein
MPRFREFSTLKTAIIGVGLIAGALAFAFAFPMLPIVQGHTYKAVFSDGGGLKPKDKVRVAGTDVGEVTDMELVGNTVEVTFNAKGIRMADNATAAIKTGTLLGKRYLGVTPGSGPEMTDDVIPISRTSTPYNVSRSLEDVGTQIQGFDKDKIEQALNSFSGAFQDTPENFKETFKNVKALSVSLNSRDQGIRELLGHANGVSAVLADRTETFRRITIEGNRLLKEIADRQEVVDNFFKDFTYVAEQARDFTKANDDQLGPVLDDFNDVLHIIEHNNSNLQLSLTRVGSFITGLGEGVANGPGFQATVALPTVGQIFNYTNLLREANNPQLPRIPAAPGLPGGIQVPPGLVPGLGDPPSGAGALEPLPPPTEANGVPKNKPWG